MGSIQLTSVRGADTMDFSLFYFANDSGIAEDDKYRLLLDGARFADEHGFCAVWTPERHFHTFGGMFPSPSVAAGAPAMITPRGGVRARSGGLPPHHPGRGAQGGGRGANPSGGR